MPGDWLAVGPRAQGAEDHARATGFNSWTDGGTFTGTGNWEERQVWGGGVATRGWAQLVLPRDTGGCLNVRPGTGRGSCCR